MDIRFVAKTYIDAGWSVVPLVKGEKRAGSSWQKKTYTVNDFGPDDGIAGKCGEPSGWRVDVDLDCDEAVIAAKDLLPNSGLIHGRPGKPDSHYWFICEGAKTTQFMDVKDTGGASAMLVEIRSTGGYTALPPSKHPSGDILGWSIERQPLVLKFEEELYPAVRSVALTSLLARHWPGPRAKHDAIGPLAGFLARAGLPGTLIIDVIRLAASIAKDAEVGDRVAFARTTVAKFKAGDPVTGSSVRLAEHFPPGVVSKLRTWLRLSDDDAIDDFNRRHFWVRMGKDDVIGREDTRDGEVVFQKPRALQSEYANQIIKVGETKKGEDKMGTVFDAWIASRNRRSYREVVFTPPPKVADPRDYNLWRGYAVEPQAGECGRFLEHIHDVVCSANPEHFKFLMHLLALTFQEPGTPSGIATVLRGGQGTGKGMFVRSLGEIFGRRHYTQLDKVEQLAGKFNAALSGKILVFADEAFFAGDKREVGALKRLITEPTLHIERKGIDGVDEDNHVHLFMATNEDWAYPAAMDERRGFLLQVSDKHKQNAEYFSLLTKELRAGGLAAFLQYMLEFTVDKELLKRAPRTSELREQQGRSLTGVLAWWQDVLYIGNIGALGWPGGQWIPVDGLYSVYADWQKNNRGRGLSHIFFGRQMSSFFSAEKPKTVRIDGKPRRCLKIRTLEDARKFFDQRFATGFEWEEIEDDAEKLPL